jgi:hypothetical protein
LGITPAFDFLSFFLVGAGTVSRRAEPPNAGPHLAGARVPLIRRLAFMPVVRSALNVAGKVGPILLALALAMVMLQGFAEAQKTPSANKFAVVGSGEMVEAPNEEVTLLSTTMKNPGSKALALSVSLECSILTQLTTIGSDLAKSWAKADVWVEVNGSPVMFDDDDTADGRVTFCEREYQRETRSWDDDDAVIEDFIRTRSSHAFNWVALHDGAGDKLVEVKAELQRSATSNADSRLVVGHRTLTVEPVDVVKDETLSN